MPKSILEQTLLFQIRAVGLPEPEAEYRFHPTRRWRFDFAYPDHKIGIECEGGTWSGGRHVRPNGFADDCEKYNEAAMMGWGVLRFPAGMIKSGEAIRVIERAFGECQGIVDVD